MSCFGSLSLNADDFNSITFKIITLLRREDSCMMQAQDSLVM
jgi:hypothetical protein